MRTLPQSTFVPQSMEYRIELVLAILASPLSGDQVAWRKAIRSRFDDSADCGSDHDIADRQRNAHLVPLQQQPVPRSKVDRQQMRSHQHPTRRKGVGTLVPPSTGNPACNVRGTG